MSKYAVYHDESLSLQRMATPLDPEKLLAWQPVLDLDFPKRFVPLIELNCMSSSQSGILFPEHLHLFGLNSTQILDFNSAFMQYGVQKKQFH